MSHSTDRSIILRFWYAGMKGTMFLVFAVVALVQQIAASVPAPVLEFTFLRSQCLQNKFLDSSNSKYVGDLGGVVGSDTNCIDGDGASSVTKLSSSLNLAPLKNLLGHNDFTIELWLQPKLNLTQAVSILSFGKDSAMSYCRNNFLISQIPAVTPPQEGTNNIEFMVETCNRQAINSGRVLKSPTYTQVAAGSPGQLLHLVICIIFESTAVNSNGFTINTISVNYTVNGINLVDDNARTYPSTFGLDAAEWDSTGYLNVFPAMELQLTENKVAAGDVHYFALYNQKLSHAATRERYTQRLPNSLPVVRPSTVTIQENGEIGDHSSQPEFYLSTIPNSELALITLTVQDMEDYAHGIPPEGQRPKAYISSFPAAAGCKIYQLDGTEIVSTPGAPRAYILYNAALGGYAVRFRPPLDQYSATPSTVLTRFAFAAVDGVTGLTSAETAWVDVIVTHVNKPPIASALSISTIASTYTTLMLDGTDPDSAVSHAVITQLPPSGRLSLINMMELSAGSSVAGPPFQLQYFYTGPQSLTGASSTAVGTDSFQYVLVDVDGRRSVPAVFSITATTALFGRPAAALLSAPKAAEDTLSSIQLFGEDKSFAPRPLWMTIVEPPVFGTLYPRSDSSALTGGARVPSHVPAGNYSTGLSVLYMSPPNYFTTPTVAWDGTALPHARDSFVYQVTAVGGGEAQPVTQFVHIQNVNDPTYMNFIYTAEWAENQAVLVVLDSASGLGEVVIEGFNITDVDFGVDLIHVTVDVANVGTLMLNSEFLAGVDFNSAKYCGFLSSWSCYGDGSTASMSFVGTPSAVSAVLNGMTYSYSGGGTEATITVTLYDGEGENCLTNQQHGDGSIRSGCYVTEVVVKVLIDSSGSSGSSSRSNGQAPLMARLMYAGIGLAICCALMALRCYCKHNNSDDDEKHTKKHQDDNEEAPGVFTAAARGLYAVLPFMSPVRQKKPHRKHRRGSAGSESSGEDSGDSSATEEEDDEEACRTPPRKGKSTARLAAYTPGQTPPRRSDRTPPCTPGTPVMTEADHKRAGTPSRAVVFTTPDGRQGTAITYFTVIGGGDNSSAPAKRLARTDIPTKAFPDIRELADWSTLIDGWSATPSLSTASPKRSKSSSPRKARRGESTDQSVSTVTCSVGDSTGPPKASPQRYSSPTRPTKRVPTSASKVLYDIDGNEMRSSAERKAARSKATHKHATTVVADDSQATEADAADIYRGSAHRLHSPNKASTAKNTPTTAKSPASESSPTNLKVLGRKIKAPPEESVWTEHVHRTGKTFYYNAETGQSKWRKPVEMDDY